MGLLGISEQSMAAENALKGMAYADYSYFATGAKKKQNAFEFRRIYLTYDLKWDDAFSGRVRLEMNDAGFGSGNKMEPFVKHAYVRYRKNGKAIYMGLSGTPTWAVSEEIWGYRSIRKTIMDLNKIASSADEGVAFHGQLDGEGRLNTQIMVANGSGQGAETDNNKKVYGLLHYKSGGLNATAYMDWEKRPANQDRTTFAGLLGLQRARFGGGIESFVQKRSQAAGDVEVRGLSVFGSGSVGEKTKAFARVDVYDPNDTVANDRTLHLIGGLDFEPTKDVHLMPNVLVTTFQAPGVDAEFLPRMTLYVKF
ncbi:MAG: hypothetical protein O3B73_14385 [bacterium]|nr:hypothetical protein [bacterium]